jgi:hypothetical protein
MAMMVVLNPTSSIQHSLQKRAVRVDSHSLYLYVVVVFVSYK